LPAEAWLFNRPGLGLVRGLDITRSGTGLASAYGAGAGDLAMTTRAASSERQASLGVTHAPALAPQWFASATAGLGVPGLRTAVGISRQIGAEAVDAEGQADVFRQHQYAARVAWQSPAGAHLLQASAIDFRRADFGGAEAPCGGGQPHCLLGADIGIDGAAASWQWQLADDWRLLALAGSSETRATVLRADLGALQPAQPAYIGMHHAELRAEIALSPQTTLSAGLMQARREYRLHGERRFVINGATAASLGMVPAGPGPGSLVYAPTCRKPMPNGRSTTARAGTAMSACAPSTPIRRRVSKPATSVTATARSRRGATRACRIAARPCRRCCARATTGCATARSCGCRMPPCAGATAMANGWRCNGAPASSAPT
jgi:hypothetical protein